MIFEVSPDGTDVVFFCIKKRKMTETHTLIPADDLTGANDTAIQFRKYGFSALVVTNIVRTDTAIFKDYDVISINSDSRKLRPNDAYRVIYDAVSAFE